METQTTKISAVTPPHVSKKMAKKKKKKKIIKKKEYVPKTRNDNHQAIKFLCKLSAYIKAQNVGALPGDIPFRWTEFFKGTQAPTIRLYSTTNLIGATSATNLASTLQVSASAFQHFTDLAAVFDEYRPIGGDVEYVPNAWPTFTNGATHQPNLEFSVGVIDYDNTTALASLDEGLEYDTKKRFYLVAAPETCEKSITHWPMKFEPLPDQQWVDCATTSTVFATWKMFCNGSDITFTNARVGQVLAWMDFQFRGSG